ncbi:MAG: SPOR domain-containing protein [Bacteroidota bacterium]|nr:SPOR domain-containing protein [Bacteroidota bacterium]
MLSKYINTLLANNKKVIVPDLGAFIRKDETPSLISFNEFLRYNDNLLIDHIVIEEGISKTEATQKVIKMVEDIHLQLGLHKQFELTGVGTLIMDENEKIQLRTAPGSTIKEKTKPDLPIIEAPREIFFNDEPAEITGHSSISTAKSEEVAEEKRTDDTSSETSAAKLFVIGAIAILTLGVITYFSFFNNSTEEMDLKVKANKEKTKPQDIINSDSIIRAQQAAKVSAEKSKDTVVAKTDAPSQPVTEKKETASSGNEKKVIKDQPTNKEAAAKPKVAEKKVEKPETTSAKPTSSAKPKITHFHVVAGSFSSEANAEKFIKDLKTQGFKAEKIGLIKNKYYVGYASFTDKESAEKEAQRLRGKGKADAWILTY